MAERSAVLLISHGSRQRHAMVFTHDLAAALRRDDPERIVAVSFLELNQPSPAEALRQLIAGGTIDIQVVPLLFSAGYHYRIDVPAAVDAALERWPDICVRTAGPLLSGADAEIVAALDARVSEAIREQPSGTQRAPDALVLLAAGSSDEKARARVGDLAHAWGHAHGLPAEVAFCDLRGDEVCVAVALLQARGARHIACGSLFLASGRLLEAGRAAAVHAGAEIVAGPLGLTPALVDLVRRRCLQPMTAG